MNEDYLWDGRGEPDPEVERLERLLRPLGHNRPLAPIRPARKPVWRWLAAAAALIAVVAGAIWWQKGRNRPAWDVANLAGAPKIGWLRVGAKGRLAEGRWLETDSKSKARLEMGEVGEVEVEPNSRVGLVRSHEGEQRMALDHGSIHALIWAPPGNFYVNTPSAVAVDLGCEYTLHVDDSGAGLVSVIRGWVAFEWSGRESFIPAGALCRTRRGGGPGTPYYADASVAFRDAVDRIDSAGVAPDRLDSVFREARQRDAFTLWHLLTRANEDDRNRVYDRLAELAAPPKSVTREGVLKGNRAMLDAWWDALGLGDASWWRLWKVTKG